jgi:hypothetical protein
MGKMTNGDHPLEECEKFSADGNDPEFLLLGIRYIQSKSYGLHSP